MLLHFAKTDTLHYFYNEEPADGRCSGKRNRQGRKKRTEKEGKRETQRESEKGIKEKRKKWGRT